MGEKVPRHFAIGRRLGDGTRIDRDLKDFLIGQEIVDVESGARTEEGYSVTRMRLRSGDSLLIIPHPVETALTVETGLRLVSLFIFQSHKPRRIITPGEMG